MRDRAWHQAQSTGGRYAVTMESNSAGARNDSKTRLAHKAQETFVLVASVNNDHKLGGLDIHSLSSRGQTPEARGPWAVLPSKEPCGDLSLPLSASGDYRWLLAVAL